MSDLNPCILIFDSGVGGLSIYEVIRNIFPKAYYLYVFDNEGFPYGKKSESFIKNRVTSIIYSILKICIPDLIIIACNTASTVSLTILKKKFKCPIIGVLPEIEEAIKITKNRIVGILATFTTLNSNYTKFLINKFSKNFKILKIQADKLVELAELKLRGHEISITELNQVLYSWIYKKTLPDVVVLGCTHFSLLNKELKLIFPKKTVMIDSSKSVILQSSLLLKNNNYNNNFSSEKKLNKNNKAYCLSLNSKIEKLLPILLKYGFNSLNLLQL